MLAGYKTMIVNGAVVLIMALTYFFPGAEAPTSEQVGALVDQADVLIGQAEALYIAALGVVNMVLRAITTTSIFSKE